MRASLIISERGVERVVSIGEGPAAVEDCLRLMERIRQEVDDFHRAVIARCSCSSSYGILWGPVRVRAERP